MNFGYVTENGVNSNYENVAIHSVLSNTFIPVNSDKTVFPIIDFYPLNDILKLCITEQLRLTSVRLNFQTAIITEERAYII